MYNIVPSQHWSSTPVQSRKRLLQRRYSSALETSSSLIPVGRGSFVWHPSRSDVWAYGLNLPTRRRSSSTLSCGSNVRVHLHDRTAVLFPLRSRLLTFPNPRKFQQAQTQAHKIDSLSIGPELLDGAVLDRPGRQPAGMSNKSVGRAVHVMHESHACRHKFTRCE